MKIRIPVIPTALGLLGLGAGVWWLSQPPPPVPASTLASDYQRLPERDQQALRGVVGAMMLSQLMTDGQDLTFGREVGQTARYHLLVRPRGFRDDCSGYVSAVFTNTGVPMDGVVASLYDLAVVHDALHWDSVPSVGDLVFFDNTTDRNRNGEWDDMNTHIGVVIDVEPDGTAVFAHSGTSAGRATGRINVARSGEYKDGTGRKLNTYLRSPEAWDPPTAGYLTGELWAGFATVDPAMDWLENPPAPESWP